MDAIFKRRSIRMYKEQEVPQEFVEKVLRAGMNAPSAGNEQPWQFIVIKEKDTLEELSRCSSFAHMVKNAPLAILVCGDLGLEKHEGFWMQDCSAATQTMLLEVADLGLGSVWLGLYPLQERFDYVKQQFSLPSEVIPFAILPVGFPVKDLKPADRYDPGRVHYEKW